MVGALAQLGEHLLCKQGVIGSIPISSTNRGTRLGWFCLDAVAAHAAALQTGRPTIADGLAPCMGDLIDAKRYPFEEIKVCIVRKN